jgi:hypothetical protein
MPKYEDVDFGAVLKVYSAANSVSSTLAMASNAACSVADSVSSTLAMAGNAACSVSSTLEMASNAACSVADSVSSTLAMAGNATYSVADSVSSTLAMAGDAAYHGANSLPMIDASRLAYLNQVRRDVRSRLAVLNDEVHSPQFIVVCDEAARISVGIQALEYFGLASGEEAKAFATQFQGSWARRLVALFRREILRSCLESFLRFVDEQIKVLLRLIRNLEFVDNLFVLQADWFILHGAHPPPESDRLAFGRILREGCAV